MSARTVLATRFSACAVLLATSLLTAACSPSQTFLGLEPNKVAASTAPVLSVQQAAEVTVRALGQAQLADAQRTETAAQLAFSGLALQTAVPEYAVEKALNSKEAAPGKALAPIAPPTRVIISAGAGFPRTLLAMWTPAGSATPQLAVLSSAQVSAPYRVSARTNLIPGTVMPQTLPNSAGAPAVPKDASDLVVTPQQALTDLAFVLGAGDSKKSKTKFGSSKVIQEVLNNAKAQAADVKNVASFKQTHQVDKTPMIAVRTADGGAIIVAALVRSDTFQVRDEAGSISPPPAYKALAKGLDKITGKATVTTIETVALTVPPKGSAPVQLIGFSEIPVALKAS